MSISMKEFCEYVERGEGEGIGKYDWSKVDALLAKGKPITVADAEAIMPEVKYRNQIRGYLERLVKSGKVVRTPKYQPRTYYVLKKVYDEYLKNNAKGSK